ncbi:hypothetical protein UFOVP233_69 [uncultured Caudovirales phage]|uniref:Tail assembly chaperone n=1 Tax=uncultured Caudovirales phage TaxID=2100421 RepID=A0A6J7WRH5_9CAUD|nr:hypothetical protein UFOVP233_69 [uncultured Caudovirales phage]
MDFALPGMDTKTLSEEGVEMVVRRIGSDEPLIGKDGTTVKIKLLGPDSTKYRALSRAQVRKRLSRMAAAGTPADSDDYAAEDEASTLSVLAACTVDWTGIMTTKGEAIPCTPETALALYTGFPAIRDQVDYFMAQRGNFTKAS